MIRIQWNGRPGFILMLLVALTIALPCQPALAALIGTDAVADFPNARVDRDQVLQLLAREDVRAALLAQGLDPAEAQARVASLSEAEIREIAGRLETLPAGGDGFGTAIAVLLIILIVVVILKVTGHLK
jgi:hypothetical protein